MTSEDNIFTEKITYTDADFFKMFSFKLLKTNTDQVLRNKNSIVISENIAKKYFGEDEPLGKRISINRSGQFHDFIVSGVIENVPENSSIQYDILLSFEKLKDFVNESYFTNWGLFSVCTYVQLNAPSHAEGINSKLPNLIEKYVGKSRAKYYLQPLKDIHFGASVQATMTPTSSITYSYILGGIALLILLIACFNFMNISTALSSMRYKEIGLRKVIGAMRSQIIIQFCCEALVLTMVAFIFGFFLAKLFLPTFNLLAGKTLTIDYFANYFLFIGAIVFIFFVGLFSSIFPVLFLSKHQPAEAFQGRQTIGGKSFFSRALVTIQFGLAIFMIVCTLIMSHQLNYLKTQNPGFNSEQIIVIPFHGGDSQHTLDNYRTELNQYSSIINITGADAYAGGGFNGAVAEKGDASYSINISRIDYNYLETFGMTLKSGRDFSKYFTSDIATAIIVNEAFVNKLGWQSAIGNKLKIKWIGGEVEVIGVIKDFHYASLHEEIAPLVFYVDPEVAIEYIFVKIAPEDIPATIALLKDKWQELAPNQPFNYSFLDQKFAQLYRSEERWSTIVKYSSMSAIFIACFGLFGLSALVIAKRTKEIGIRKVLGASVAGIILLLSKEFSKWVLLANIFAWPIAWYAMNKWLQNFAYRINIGWWPFLLAGVLVLVIALLTVSYQAIRAALANPVESLRYE